MTSHDNLESFIHDNREAFDHAYPSLRTWADIERTLDGRADPTVAIRRAVYWRIAAAVLVLLTVTGVIGHYLGVRSAQRQELATIQSVAPEFLEMQDYYQQQVKERYAQLTQYHQDKTIDADLAQIDRAMEELRNELATAPRGREKQIVEDLIRNYQLKVQILERVLEQLRATDNYSQNHSNNERKI